MLPGLVIGSTMPGGDRADDRVLDRELPGLLVGVSRSSRLRASQCLAHAGAGESPDFLFHLGDHTLVIEVTEMVSPRVR